MSPSPFPPKICKRWFGGTGGGFLRDFRPWYRPLIFPLVFSSALPFTSDVMMSIQYGAPSCRRCVSFHASLRSPSPTGRISSSLTIYAQLRLLLRKIPTPSFFLTEHTSHDHPRIPPSFIPSFPEQLLPQPRLHQQPSDQTLGSQDPNLSQQRRQAALI